jgi:hypothetical protein
MPSFGEFRFVIRKRYWNQFCVRIPGAMMEVGHLFDGKYAQILISRVQDG